MHSVLRLVPTKFTPIYLVESAGETTVRPSFWRMCYSPATFIMKINRLSPFALGFALGLYAIFPVQATITVLDYWHMGENDSGAIVGGTPTTATDSAAAHDLKYTGSAVYSSDVSAAAQTHVGSLLAVAFTNSAFASNSVVSTLQDNFGYEAWVKPVSLSGNPIILNNGNTGTTGWGLVINGSTYQGIFGGITYVGSATATINVWTHLAVVRNNGVATLYVNGVAAGSTATGTPNFPTGNFGVGAQSLGTASQFFNGLVDEVRIFKFAAGQFSTNDLLVNSTRPTVTNLTAFSGEFSTNENLFATASANGTAATVSFQYGLTTNYGSSILATNLPADFSTVQIIVPLSGLTPGTSYHYRFVATNSAGSSIGADQAFMTRNDILDVRAYYRMGEMDGTKYQAAVSGSQSTLIIDSVGGHHAPVVNPGTYNDATISAQPVYTTNVAISAVNYVGSSCALDFINGNAYGMSSVFYPGTDNFCLEAWVKAGSLSGYQYIIYNGSANNGWGLSLNNGVYHAISLTQSWANYIGEDFGSAPASLTEWTHLALVSNNGAVTFYANGIPTGSPAHPLGLQGGYFTLGKGPVFTHRFGGQLDEVRLSTFPGGQFNVTNLLLKGIPPVVTSPTSAAITSSNAVLGGTVTGQGGPPVTECGVVFSVASVNMNPAIGGLGVTRVLSGGSTGVFTAAITGLAPATIYSFRPYAINTFGPVYGPASVFDSAFLGFTPLVYFRMGEADLGATAGGTSTNTFDSVGTNVLMLTGAPVYSTDTPTNQSSSLSLNFGSGTASGSCSLLPALTDNFGFEVWVKPTTNSGPYFILYNGNGGSSGWGVLQNGGVYQVLFGGVVAFASGSVTLNQWTHLALVRDSGVATFYVNGAASGTNTSAPAMPVGNFAVNGGWSGSIDEMRLFAFPAGTFTMGNLLLKATAIGIEQPLGTSLGNGGTRDFGSPAVGSSADLMFTIKNNGNTNLTGLGISIDGADAALFSVATNPVAPVVAGGSTTFTVRFTPVSVGAKTAALHLNSNDTYKNPFNFTLTGTGLSSEIAIEQPFGTALAIGGNKDFGPVVAGNNTTLTFTVRNTGNADLILSGTPEVVIAGANAADFTVMAQPLSPVPGIAALGFTNAGFETPAQSANGFTYNPGGTGWTFGSTAGLAANGSPWFVNAAPEGSQAAFIQRNASGDAAATISQTISFPGAGNHTIRFSLVRRGASFPANDVDVRMDGVTLGTMLNTSQPDDVWRTFTISYNGNNVGNHTLAFVGTRAGGDYASALDNVQIFEETETTFDVTFAPAAAGLRTATMSIANNCGYKNPYAITFTGTGATSKITVEQPSGTPIPDGGSRDFGSVNVQTNATLTFTLRNTGLAPLTLSGIPKIVVGGAQATEFTVTAQPTSPVVADGNAVSLTNASFEMPAFSPGTFAYAPSGAGWTFGSKAGIAGNGSPWFVNAAPKGIQAAFIQLNTVDAILSQIVNFSAPGNYVLRFSMVRRSASFPANDVDVRMDGVTLGTVLNTSQPDDVWRTFTMPYLCTNAGNHTLAFVGTRGGSDNASALDNVEFLNATTFQVTFTPAAGGVRTATLSITNDAPDGNPYHMVLTGTVPVPPPISPQSLTVLGNGAFQFTFTDTNNLIFSVLTSTNIGLPVTNWTVLGTVTNLGGSLYQFADPAATNFPGRFYQLRFP